MASERQLQDRGKSTLEDSLEIEDAQQITDSTMIPAAPVNSASDSDRAHLEKVELLKQKLRDSLNSVDTNATIN